MLKQCSQSHNPKGTGETGCVFLGRGSYILLKVTLQPQAEGQRHLFVQRSSSAVAAAIADIAVEDCYYGREATVAVPDMISLIGSPR